MINSLNNYNCQLLTNNHAKKKKRLLVKKFNHLHTFSHLQNGGVTHKRDFVLRYNDSLTKNMYIKCIWKNSTTHNNSLPVAWPSISTCSCTNVQMFILQITLTLTLSMHFRTATNSSRWSQNSKLNYISKLVTGSRSQINFSYIWQHKNITQLQSEAKQNKKQKNN